MVVGEIPEAVDMLVIGGGPGGYTAALAAAHSGRKVVLVEAGGTSALGGVCLQVGCIPSKALIELADQLQGGRAWTSRGLPAIAEQDVDLKAFQVWKDELTGGLRDGVQGLLRQAGVDVRRGYFRFTRPDQGALVTDPQAPPTHLRFSSCVAATGSRPAALPHLPVDNVRILDSSGALALDSVPGTLAIVGGGYVGVELGTAFAKLGAKVVIIEVQERLLPTMPPAVHEAVTTSLAELGVEIHTSTIVTHDDGARIHLESGAGIRALPVDAVVVAAGRTPNADDLGLGALGVEVDSRGLLTPAADRLITPNIAAIGDITPGPALAHKASAEAHVAVEALNGHRVKFEPAAVPAVVFSDPEVAQAGLSPGDSANTGLELMSASFPLSASGRARTLHQGTGFFEWTYDAAGILRGALVVGPHASELIASAVAAIEMGAHLEDVAGTVHAHPTLSEMGFETALVALGRPVHMPLRAKALDRRGSKP